LHAAAICGWERVVTRQNLPDGAAEKRGGKGADRHRTPIAEFCPEAIDAEQGGNGNRSKEDGYFEKWPRHREHLRGEKPYGRPAAPEKRESEQRGQAGGENEKHRTEAPGEQCGEEQDQAYENGHEETVRRGEKRG